MDTAIPGRLWTGSSHSDDSLEPLSPTPCRKTMAGAGPESSTAERRYGRPPAVVCGLFFLRGSAMRRR
jgi:hypothetical protein